MQLQLKGGRHEGIIDKGDIRETRTPTIGLKTSLMTLCTYVLYSETAIWCQHITESLERLRAGQCIFTELHRATQDCIIHCTLLKGHRPISQTDSPAILEENIEGSAGTKEPQDRQT